MTISTDQTIEQLLTQQTGSVRTYVMARVEARRYTARYYDFEAENCRAVANSLLSQATGDERRAMILIGRAMARDGSISDAGHFIAYARDLFDAQRVEREEMREVNSILGAAIAQAANRNEPSRMADGFLGTTEAVPTTIPPTEEGADPYERIRALEAALGDMVKLAECYADYLEGEADTRHSASSRGMEAAERFRTVSDDIATAKAVLGE